MACDTTIEAFQESQEATEPWNGLATDSLDQGNPLETDLRQGRELAISSKLVSRYLANPGEQGPNFSLLSNACGNHECLNGRQQVSSLQSTTGGDDTEDKDEEILRLRLAALEIRIKLEKLKKRRLKSAQRKINYNAIYV